MSVSIWRAHSGRKNEGKKKLKRERGGEEKFEEKEGGRRGNEMNTFFTQLKKHSSLIIILWLVSLYYYYAECVCEEFFFWNGRKKNCEGGILLFGSFSVIESWRGGKWIERWREGERTKERCEFNGVLLSEQINPKSHSCWWSSYLLDDMTQKLNKRYIKVQGKGWVRLREMIVKKGVRERESWRELREECWTRRQVEML